MAHTAHIRHMKQDITHWIVVGSNGFGGFTYGPPSVMLGRWEQIATRFVAADGEETTSSAVAYVPKDIVVGDYLAEGDHKHLTDPSILPAAFRARQFQRITDLRNMNAVRKVFM